MVQIFFMWLNFSPFGDSTAHDSEVSFHVSVVSLIKTNSFCADKGR
jgi:hypothetical protein